VDPRSTRWLQIGGSSGDGDGNGGVPVPTCWRQLEVAPITFWCCFFAHCLPFTICLIWPNELRRFNFELRYDGNGSLDTATCWAHNGDWNVICQNKFNGLSSRRRNAPEGSKNRTQDRIGWDHIDPNAICSLDNVPQWRACSTRVLISSKQPTRYQRPSSPSH